MWGAEVDIDYAPEFFVRNDFSTDRRLTTVMVNGIPRMSNGQVKKLQERVIAAVDAEVAAK